MFRASAIASFEAIEFPNYNYRCLLMGLNYNRKTLLRDRLTIKSFKYLISHFKVYICLIPSELFSFLQTNILGLQVLKFVIFEMQGQPSISHPVGSISSPQMDIDSFEEYEDFNAHSRAHHVL